MVLLGFVLMFILFCTSWYVPMFFAFLDWIPWSYLGGFAYWSLVIFLRAILSQQTWWFGLNSKFLMFFMVSVDPWFRTVLCQMELEILISIFYWGILSLSQISFESITWAERLIRSKFWCSSGHPESGHWLFWWCHPKGTEVVDGDATLTVWFAL